MRRNSSVRLNLVVAMCALLFAGSSALAQGPPPVMAQIPFVSALAGNTTGALISPCTGSANSAGGNYGDGCPATQAIVSTPYASSVDSQGNVYFSDEGHTYIRVVYQGGATAAAMITAANPSLTGLTPVAGDVYALAGGLTAAITVKNTDTLLACGNVAGNGDAENSAGDGCPATQAFINEPFGAAVDSAGDVFIVDRGGSKIHVVYAGGSLAAALITLETPSVTTPKIGYVYLIAGGSSGYADGVLATSGKVKNPGGMVVDSNENLYIADTGNNAIREVSGSTGFIHTIGGNCTSSACTALTTAPVNNTAAVGAGFASPQAIGVDSSGNVYIADDSATQGNNTAVYPSVRVIYSGGTSNPAASLICLENGSSGYGILAGSCSASTLTANHVYTIAGKQTNVSATSGNGLFAASAQFEKLTGLAVDKNGNVYIGDDGSSAIVGEINANTGYMSFIAGDGQASNGNPVLLTSFCAPGATSGLQPTDIDGDGCPATQSYSHHIEGNMAVDGSGNVYYSDSTNNLVRELKFNNSFQSSALSVGATQQYAFALLPATTSLTLGTPSVVTEGAASGPFAIAATGSTCTNGTVLSGTSSSTNNTTCLLDVTFTPSKVGPVEGAIQIAGPTSAEITAYLSGLGTGAELAIDPSTSSTIGSGTTPQGVATDASGNTYIDFAGTGTVTSTGGALSATAGTGLSQPYQIAVDGAGNVFVADSGNSRIAEFAAGSSTGVTAITGLSSPKGIAFDAASNFYIADTGNARVLFQANGNGQQQVLGSGFTTPVAVAVDASGNVYVADTGLGAIVKIAAGTGVQTTVLSGIKPVGLSVDAAGDIEYVDSALKEVVEIPVSGANTAVVSGLTTPVGVALDANGGLYVADTANTGVSFYNRTSSTQGFASLSNVLSANLTNIGNAGYTETGSTFTQTDNTDFNVTPAASNGCVFASPIAAGENCTMSAQFTPGVAGPLSDTVTFSGNAANAGSVVLNLSGNGVVSVSTTTSLGATSPAAPVYGQSVQVTVTVSPSSGTTIPTGNVTFTVDGVAQTPVGLVGGAYTLTLSSLNAGSHTISATYAGGGNFSGSSTTTPLSFSVARLGITATTNSVTSTYGQSLPTLTGTLTGVLSADQANVSPIFSVAATSTSPVGSYPISVTLTGSAATNYAVTLTGTPTLAIQQVTVTLAVANATKVYGASLPTFTGTFTGVLATDQANVVGVYSTTATASSVVASYPVSATALTGSAAGNYKLGTVTPGSLSVTPLAITTSATPGTVTYGQAIPTITGSALSGVLAADAANVTAVFSTTATSTSPVGTYPISVALSGSAAGNYTVSLTTAAVVTVQVATVTVAVNGATRAYGAANPTFSGVLTGVLAKDAANVAATYSTTATATSAPASYSITTTALTGTAAGNYKLGTVTAGSLVVTQAGTTTGLTSSVSTVGEGNSVTFTATVASSTTGSPTGSVTFYLGTTSLGTGVISGGVATFSTTTLAYGVQAITATYGGSVDFTVSTSPAVSVTVGLPVVTATPSASSVTISNGGTGTVTLNIVASGNYVGTASYSCFSLPADMSCAFSPATATFTSASTTATTTLTISTKSATTALLHAPHTPGKNRSPFGIPLMAICFPGAILGFFGLRKRRLLQGLMLLVVMLAGVAGIGGCASGSPAADTPAGTYNIQVEITAGTVQMVPLTVVVQ